MITTIKNGDVDYSLVVSDKTTGSLFRSVASGINTPKEISIRHQDYVDSKTKKLGRRSVVRKDVFILMTDGTIAPVSVMIVAMVPRDANVTSSVIADALGVSLSMHGHGTENTDIGTEVFANGSQ
jgi:hypothetical protein